MSPPDDLSNQQNHSWREALRVYANPKVFAMLFLGFSAGLPFVLVFSTLSAWLADAQVSRTTIGFFSWIGLMYSIKIFWAPLVDKVPLPMLGKLMGQRRSWMLVSQSGIVIGLVLLALTEPQNQLQLFAFYALLVAFSSATQDIVIDAYRIEALKKEYQAAMAASYVYGYKMATLVAAAGGLYLADFINWQVTYLVMAVFAGVGIVATLIIKEQERHIESETMAYEATLTNKVEAVINAQGFLQKITDWFVSAVVSPFADFFHRNGKMALVILLLISTYRITDITMGVMANPFYLDLGFTKSEIASITKIFSVIMFFVGALVGGILTVRFGILKTLLSGGIFVILSNALFAWLSLSGPELSKLAIVISVDSLAGGIATTVFIAYLSSLTNKAYTATQYALFSSFMTLLPKIIAGFSGIVVDAYGYFVFYIYTSLLGVPALLLVLYLLNDQKKNSSINN